MNDTSGIKRLIWSNLAAQSADQLGLATVALVAATVLGANAAGIGLLSAAQTLPFLLLSLPAGLLADRCSRRRLMASAELTRALALALLPVLVLAGALTLPLLGIVGFAAAIGTVVYTVAAPALVPALVPRSGLAAANGQLELARSAAFTAGPALGGALVAAMGAAPALAVAAALSLAACILLAGLPEPPRNPAGARHPWTELKDGAAFAWRQPLLRAILLTAVGWNTSWFVLQAVFVLFALQRLGMATAAVGAALGLFGIGMVAGSLAAPALIRRWRFGAVILTGPMLSFAAAGLLLATTVLPWPGLAFAAFFVIGAGSIVWTIAQTTLRQAVTPPGLLGRVSAVMLMATAGARPLGAALGGLVGTRFGLGAAIAVATAGFGVQALAALLSPIPSLRVLPDLACQISPSSPA